MTSIPADRLPDSPDGFAQVGAGSSSSRSPGEWGGDGGFTLPESWKGADHWDATDLQREFVALREASNSPLRSDLERTYDRLEQLSRLVRQSYGPDLQALAERIDERSGMILRALDAGSEL